MSVGRNNLKQVFSHRVHEGPCVDWEEAEGRTDK